MSTIHYRRTERSLEISRKIENNSDPAMVVADNENKGGVGSKSTRNYIRYGPKRPGSQKYVVNQQPRRSKSREEQDSEERQQFLAKQENFELTSSDSGNGVGASPVRVGVLDDDEYESPTTTATTAASPEKLSIFQKVDKNKEHGSCDTFNNCLVTFFECVFVVL